MISKRYRHSLRTRLFGPLLALLFIYALLFGYLVINFRLKYSSLSQQMTDHSQVNRHIIEVARTRSRMQEALLMFRVTGDSHYMNELTSLDSIRTESLQKLSDFANKQPELQVLSGSLVAGMIESSHLRSEMVLAIQQKNLQRADEAFRQLSVIYEVNSARLKDFSLRLESKLREDEQSLQSLVVRAFWTFAFVISSVGFIILLIVSFYRKGVLQPLQQLQRGLQALTAGDLKSRINARFAPTELLDMINAFNVMAQSLENAQDQVKHALKLRDDFLSIASHELKTPLTSLRLHVQITKHSLSIDPSKPMTEEQVAELMSQVETQVTRLNTLIDDMLDISRIESGKFEPKLERVNLGELVTNTCKDFARQLKSAGGVNFERIEPVVGSWDKYRIEQVIVNLLTNAMKYGANKPISIQVFQEKQRAIFIVKDQGIGIAKENQRKIFERFERVGAASGIPGLGLGLYIVNKIVATHHGTISVDSEPGEGSSFTVSLPLQL